MLSRVEIVTTDLIKIDILLLFTEIFLEHSVGERISSPNFAE